MDYSLWFTGCPFMFDYGYICYCQNAHCRKSSKYQIISDVEYAVFHSHDADLSILFQHLAPWANTIAKDPRGNMIIHKIVSRLSTKSMLAFVDELNCFDVAKNRYGCRCLPEMIERESVADAVFKKLAPQLIELSKHVRGNYTVTALCRSVSIQNLKKIVSLYSEHITQLAIHPQAAHSVQVLFRRCNDDRVPSSCIDNLIRPLIQMGPPLLHHKYGNYTAQKFLPLLTRDLCNEFVEMMKENLVDIVRDHKRAGRVLEELIENGSTETQQMLLNRFLHCSPSEIQRVREYTSPYLRRKLISASPEKIRESVRELVQGNGGRTNRSRSD